MKLRLTIDVEYEPNGRSQEELMDTLSYAARHLVSEGLLTGDSNATVNTWEETIEAIEQE